ncbi:MAG TPA: hypothetical protein DD670_16625 [Planctomycetaceae bacterium]|nr:hypothetical protein [Planctomycetaceae bacterium]
MVALPEYELFSQADVGDEPGRWRFVLRKPDEQSPLEVGDVEPDVHGERLELLAVVRGLEALDRPSRVLLVTSSTYVREGMRYGLEEWRSNDWQWESYGQMVPVKNRDLWQRIDRALQFHQVECRTWRVDQAHVDIPAPHRPVEHPELTQSDEGRFAALPRIKPRLRRLIRTSYKRIASGLKELQRVACSY